MKEPCYCYQDFLKRVEQSSEDPLSIFLANSTFNINTTILELEESTPLVSSLIGRHNHCQLWVITANQF